MTVMTVILVVIQNRPAFSSKRKKLLKKSLSLSQLILKAPVNKGSRAFPAGAKGRKRFTSLSQTYETGTWYLFQLKFPQKCK